MMSVSGWYGKKKYRVGCQKFWILDFSYGFNINEFCDLIKLCKILEICFFIYKVEIII